MGKKKQTQEDAERMFRQKFARQGAAARAKKLSPERRREIAKKAAAARWKK